MHTKTGRIKTGHTKTGHTKNVVVVGLDAENLAILRDLPDPSYRFHGLFDAESLVGVDGLDPPGLGR